MARKRKTETVTTEDVNITVDELPTTETTANVIVKDEKIIDPDDIKPSEDDRPEDHDKPVEKEVDDKTGEIHKPSGEYLDCVIEVLRHSMFDGVQVVSIYDIYMNDSTVIIKDKEGHVLSTCAQGLNVAMQLMLSRRYRAEGCPDGIKYTWVKVA